MYPLFKQSGFPRSSSIKYEQIVLKWFKTMDKIQYELVSTLTSDKLRPPPKTILTYLTYICNS